MSEHDSDHEYDDPDHDRDRDRDLTDDEHGDASTFDGTEAETGPTYCAYTDYTQDGPAVESLPATGEGSTGLERRVWDALYEIDDPEMPVSIVDLGLIYGVRVVESGDKGSSGDESAVEIDGNDEDDAAGARVAIDMTLTYTGCPARKMLTDEVRETVEGIEGVSEVTLELVWSPNWSLEMVTDQGRADLREFGLSVPEPGEEAA